MFFSTLPLEFTPLEASLELDMGINHFQVIQSALLKTFVGGHQQPFQMVTKNHPQKGTKNSRPPPA